MPLLIGYDPAGLDLKTRTVIDEITAAIQVWAGRVEGINAAERLNELSTGIASLPTVPTGAMFSWPTATAPTGYLICDGSALNPTTHANLIALIGPTLPDYRGRFLFGKAASGTGSTLLGTFGAIDHTHTISGSTANESEHTHGAGSFAAPAHDHGGSTSVPTGETQIEVDATLGGATEFTLSHVNSVEEHAHSITQQAAATITGTSAAGSAHLHGAGTLATAAANPPGLAANVIIKT